MLSTIKGLGGLSHPGSYATTGRTVLLRGGVATSGSSAWWKLAGTAQASSRSAFGLIFNGEIHKKILNVHVALHCS